MSHWPKQDYASMVAFYGPVGENQTKLDLPYPMVLDWDEGTIIKRITCHEKVAESLDRILTKTLNHYGIERIRKLRLHRFGGCLNVRRMRGGTAWSIHSWGAAIDIDPGRNQLRWGKDKASLAKKEYFPFWDIVESEGCTSLGRERNYDWMHAQWARL